MLTTMDTLDSASLSHASPTKAGEAEEVEALPPPVPAEQGHLTSSFLLASLPSRIGALWTSAEPGECAHTVSILVEARPPRALCLTSSALSWTSQQISS